MESCCLSKYLSNGQEDDKAQSESLEKFEGRLYMPCVLYV